MQWSKKPNGGRMVKFYRAIQVLSLSSSLLLSSFCFGQNIINNGNGIIINSGAYLVIGGDFVNLTASQDGFSDCDGTIILKGDFINNSPNGVFVNQEATPDGSLIMNNSNLQQIGGNEASVFENLTIRNGKKLLNSNLCETNGVLTLDCIFELNSNIFILNFQNPAAIQHQSGYIFAETPPSSGLGTIRWKINSALGNYLVPFGAGYSSEADLTINLGLKTPSSNDGFVDFSTWPTNAQNSPMPNSVFSMDPYDPTLVANRFWLVSPNFSNTPNVNIGFHYLDFDHQDITEKSLQAIRYNNNLNVWDDWGPDGSADVNTNYLSTSVISQNNWFDYWTLVGENPTDYLFVPSAFSPNGDGSNDIFKPVFSEENISDYYFMIIDRWGKILYETEDIQEGWNGNYMDNICQQDVYTWVISYCDVFGKRKREFGKVTIVR